VEGRKDPKAEKAKLDKLVERADKDRGFAERARKNPVAVLEEAGLSKDAMGDFLREEGFASRDPNEPGLSAEHRRAVEAARLCETCCISCMFTSECKLTIG
jgi:hypothetical protein